MILWILLKLFKSKLCELLANISFSCVNCCHFRCNLTQLSTNFGPTLSYLELKFVGNTFCHTFIVSTPLCEVGLFDRLISLPRQRYTFKNCTYDNQLYANKKKHSRHVFYEYNQNKVHELSIPAVAKHCARAYVEMLGKVTYRGAGS